jgi:YebC/PmpR family DNA-binding regulatory protein
MSGHNKWSTIKRKKGALDSKRSKIFSKIIKDIQVAVRESGPDPDGNPRLRLAIQNAKGASMPKDNVERAIKGSSDKDAKDLLELTFEGYLAHGIAIFVECTTNNQQRTVSNVRSIFNKFNGNMGTNGSLSFLFDRKGIFDIPKQNYNPDLELDLIDAGAEDISEEEESVIITTAMEDFGKMLKKLEELKVEVENARLQRIPKETIRLNKEDSLKILKAVDFFEDDEDVQNVYHNMEITDEVMAEMED